MSELVKRTYVYIERPRVFEISGCSCGNNDPEWSEYNGHLWCPKCEKDFEPKHGGVFDGPICVNLCELLGIYFDTLDLETGEIKPGPSEIQHFFMKEEG